jgi:hypothetical protein
VFLDEPSTGLDPASRATLWDVIKRAKKERAIVLTTHAMEEAEELCDRLGIFVDGSMRCVGAPKELTARYGGFLVLTLTTTALQLAETEAFVRQLSPNAQRTYALGSTLKYDLPLSEVNLASVFAAVSERKDALGIIDWGVSNMTLEEVRASAAQRATGLPLTRFPPAGFHQARARDWCHHQGVIQSIAFKEYNAYSNTCVVPRQSIALSPIRYTFHSAPPSYGAVQARGGVRQGRPAVRGGVAAHARRRRGQRGARTTALSCLCHLRRACASADAPRAQEGTVCVFDARSFDVTARLRDAGGAGDAVTSLAFHPGTTHASPACHRSLHSPSCD